MRFDELKPGQIFIFKEEMEGNADRYIRLFDMEEKNEYDIVAVAECGFQINRFDIDDDEEVVLANI